MPPRFVVAVTGGKGGTGKSFVATNIAVLMSRHVELTLADLDVEAPNDHLLLGLQGLENEEPIAIFFPIIDYKKCTACGACAKVCDTGAIVMAKGTPPMVMPRLCSGCKACLYACPYKAIDPEGRRVVGYSYSTLVKRGGGFRLITGILREGEEHTPPAIVVAKQRALKETPSDAMLIVDTGAGTGNGISAAIQEAELVIAVTEPTPLGLHDLRAILEIARGMEKRIWMVINKAGIASHEKHLETAKEYGVEKVFLVPYDPEAAKIYARGTPVVEECPSCEASKALNEIAQSLLVEALEKGVRRK
ncbi:ATP-binding protein [Pyrofollis japonicus]|uniref:P-loop NTPase n=1 Tax=Pyrofollis japonicus TaxID=3060460 RepID=UPI00295A5E35|nr:P-loop NTPase [Pyrofollis japonicus]BEP16683.1 ATP-binding protein [Pyrofollis japonicus]